MTRSEAQALVATLAAAWPRQPIEQPTLDIYAHDLADLPFEIAAEAITELRRTATFFPAIAEIRTLADELRLGAPTPMLAWEQACTRGALRHELVQRARGIVGDDWAWRTNSAEHLRRSFLGAYAEVKAEALRDLREQAELGADVRELGA